MPLVDFLIVYYGPFEYLLEFSFWFTHFYLPTPAPLTLASKCTGTVILILGVVCSMQALQFV